MAKVLDNINDIITVKNELKNILVAVGMEPSDNFEEYSDAFRRALEIIQIQSDEILGE